jgi:glycosyltransferase involved in cell wall biosynthesis
MRKPVVTIFYQFDPWSNSLGGIQTTIRSYVKYAPDTFDVQIVGIEDDSSQPVGIWRDGELAGRAIRFMPLFIQRNDNYGSFIPVTIKYAGALVGKKFTSDFMHFHRIEPTLAALNWQADKTLFVHNDIQKQMAPGDNKNAILWRRIPSAYFALERLATSQFTEILSCNTASTDFYKKNYPSVAGRVRYLRNTVDEEFFYPLSALERQERRLALTKKLSLTADTRFILFAGRLHPQKDPVLLIKAIAALKDSSAHLLVAGEGDLGEAMRAEIQQLGLGKQVTMLGAIAQSELAELQRLCNIFILTSSYEGLPLVVLEALACGNPVVTTRAGETPQLLRPGSGVVCEERTPEAIANALRQVLMNPTDFPAEACIRSAEPYRASIVVREVYDNMMKRWKLRNPSFFSPSSI